MNTFALTVASPDGELFKGEASKLSLRGIGGELAILARHVPFVTAVLPGKIRIVLPDGCEKLFSIEGGLLTVSSASVTLLTNVMIDV